jgi:predicted nucleic acid-binding protein
LNGYADTSFVASLYMPDANSARAVRHMRQLALPLLFSGLGELELLNAFRLRLFRKEMSPAHARAGLGAFRDDLGNGIIAVRPMAEEIYAQAEFLAAKWTARLGTRTLDILHVASAIILEAESFLTFDERQRKLASAAGLAVS